MYIQKLKSDDSATQVNKFHKHFSVQTIKRIYQIKMDNKTSQNEEPADRQLNDMLLGVETPNFTIQKYNSFWNSGINITANGHHILSNAIFLFYLKSGV